MKKDYLPIGSVVLLKGAKKKLMITGFYVKADGHLAKNETLTKWGKKYTFDENGVLVR